MKYLIVVLLCVLCLLLPGVEAQGGAVQITLAWDDTANVGHTGYRVYRKRGQLGTFALTGTATATERLLTVSLPTGQIYCFVAVTFVTEDGVTVESPRSNQECTARLIAPVNITFRIP